MYVKVFRSIFDGSLYGKFEATIVFLALLVIADKDGVIDMTPEKLAAECGYPLDIIIKGLDELQQPDPRSRTPDDDGRRIVLLHDAGWGWRIVNYAKYREIRSAEERREYFRVKKQEQRSASKSVNTVHQSPPKSTAVNPSEAEAEAEAEAGKRKSEKERATRLPDDFSLTPERRRSAVNEGLDADRTFSKFTDYWRAVPGAKAKKLDWDATWRNWCRGERDRSPRHQQESSRAREFPS